MCTGNTCRSPMAAAILARYLADQGVDARVASAGTRPWLGGATDDAVTAMGEQGLDITSHESRQLTADLLGGTDLVLAMTRDHAAIVAARSPDAAARTFLVGELARLGEEVGPRAPNEPPGDWVARAAAARPAARRLGRAVDEVADPAGRPLSAYRETAARLDRHLAAIAALLAGEPAAATGSPR